MVLALDYMKRTGQDLPAVADRARKHIAAGYERLLGFEVREEPGGFDWWGKAPANLFLTAYALMEFRDLAEVHPVDPRLLDRIQAWLLARQAKDGSWGVRGERVGWSTDMAKGRAFPLTAYIQWGLARAGAPSLQARSWLLREAPSATDPYGMALAALALLTDDPEHKAGRALLDRLATAAVPDEMGARWQPEGETGVGARGESAEIETTALAVQALLLGGRHPALAAQGLERLAAWRGKDGRFGTTQSTILALKAFLAAETTEGRRGDLDVEVGDGRDLLRRVRVETEGADPVHLDLGAISGREVRLGATGSGRVRATLARTTWLPWTAPADEKGRLALDVAWPREVLPVGKPAEATATVRNRSRTETASVVTLEIGIPPGCTVERSDVRGEGAENVERDETTVVVYLRDLPPGASRTFRIGFRPRFAFAAVTAPSKAYEYYCPEEAVVVPPQPVRAAR